MIQPHQNWYDQREIECLVGSPKKKFGEARNASRDYLHRPIRAGRLPFGGCITIKWDIDIEIGDISVVGGFEYGDKPLFGVNCTYIHGYWPSNKGKTGDHNMSWIETWIPNKLDCHTNIQEKYTSAVVSNHCLVLKQECKSMPPIRVPRRQVVYPRDLKTTWVSRAHLYALNIANISDYLSKGCRGRIKRCTLSEKMTESDDSISPAVACAWGSSSYNNKKTTY